MRPRREDPMFRSIRAAGALITLGLAAAAAPALAQDCAPSQWGAEDEIG